MKKLILLGVIFLAGVTIANAQTGETVTISKEAAIKCLQDQDELKAVKVELAVKDKAIADLEKRITDLQIEIAKMTGDKTGAEQMVVRLSAMVDLLLKSTKPKQNGLINIHF